MTDLAAVFGKPKIKPGRKLVLRMGAAAAAAPIDQTAEAEAIMANLGRLHDADLAADVSSLSQKYERLSDTYADALRLRNDNELRDEFFASQLWHDHEGHKPNPDRHGPEDAIFFAVMRVFGGSTERRKEASMFAAACWMLADLNVTRGIR